MHAPSQSVINSLAVTIVAVLVAAIVSVFTVGGGSHPSPVASTAPPSRPSVSSAEGGPTTTTAGQPTSTAKPGAATTSTTVGPGSGPGSGPATTTTTAAPLPVAAGPVGDPGQPSAEAAGTYSYNYSLTSSRGDDTGIESEKVTAVSKTGGVTRQSVVDNGPGIQASANTVVEWRPAGFFQISEGINFGGQSATCSWNPAVQEVPTGLSVGKTWNLAGSCALTVYAQPVTIHLTGTGKVTDKQRLKVGSDDVNVWVISAQYTAMASSPAIGTFNIHYQGIDDFAASLGEVVEENSTETVTSASSNTSATVHRALQSVHPHS